MKLFLLLSLSLILFFSCSFNSEKKQVSIPKDWKKIEVCGLSFYTPSDFEEIQTHPKDSCVKNYRNNDIFISLDLFWASGKESDSRKSEYSDRKEFQIMETQIDSQKAEIITYFVEDDFIERKELPYGAVLFVPVVNNNNDNLTIWTYSRSLETRQTTEKIFETIKFKK